MNFNQAFNRDARIARRFHLPAIAGALGALAAVDNISTNVDEYVALENGDRATFWCNPYAFCLMMDAYVQGIGTANRWEREKTRTVLHGKLTANWRIQPEQLTNANVTAQQARIIEAVRGTGIDRARLVTMWGQWVTMYNEMRELNTMVEIGTRSVLVAGENLPPFLPSGFLDMLAAGCLHLPQRLFTAEGRAFFTALWRGTAVAWPRPAAPAEGQPAVARVLPDGCLLPSGVAMEAAVVYYRLELPALPAAHANFIIAIEQYEGQWNAMTEEDILSIYNWMYRVEPGQAKEILAGSLFTMTSALAKSGNATETWYEKKYAVLCNNAPELRNRNISSVEIIRNYYDHYCDRDPPTSEQLYRRFIGISTLYRGTLAPMDWIVEQAKINNVSSAVAFASSVVQYQYMTYTVMRNAHFGEAQFTAFARLAAACIRDPYCCANRPVVVLAEYADLAYLGTLIAFRDQQRNRAGGYRGRPDARCQLSMAALQGFADGVIRTHANIAADTGSALGIASAYGLRFRERNGTFEQILAPGENNNQDGGAPLTFSSAGALLGSIQQNAQDRALHLLCTSFLAAGHQSRLPDVEEGSVPHYCRNLTAAELEAVELFGVDIENNNVNYPRINVPEMGAKTIPLPPALDLVRNNDPPADDNN
jgi:hypothetical protein